MIVTQIEEISKNRSKIYIDSEFAFVLYKGEFRLYGVKTGEELPEEDYRRILEEVLPRRAKQRAMNLLKTKAYTTAQLRMKLKQGFYPNAVIEEALEYVASYHYTDDLRYALDYIACRENDRSRRRIEQDLLSKGIDRGILEEAWKCWEARGGEQKERDIIHKLLEKRQYDPLNADCKGRQKLFGYLMRKGFSADAVRKALGGFCDMNE